jgi:mannose-6-phosphate isomerase-like protein (cupin superfamily)
MDGELVDDPLFRQRYRFRHAGDVLRIEIRTEPGGGVLADHVHPLLEERYELIEGEVTFRVDGKPVVASPGAKVVVASGVRHSFQNTGTDTSYLEVEAYPPLRLQESITEGAMLGRAEKLTATGKPRSIARADRGGRPRAALPRDRGPELAAARRSAPVVPAAGPLLVRRPIALARSDVTSDTTVGADREGRRGRLGDLMVVDTRPETGGSTTSVTPPYGVVARR